MKTNIFQAVRSTLVGVALCMAPFAAAKAADFPTKPVTIIVPFPAGGSADAVARTLAKSLSDKWNQSVVVVNRPGAGTIIGLNAVQTAAPDGYTIGINSISHVVQPSVRTKLPYDPVEDFTFITKLLEAPWVLTVNSSLPVKSVDELTAYMKDKPGELNYASFGVGSAGHILAEILLQHTGARGTHVPYKGTAEATLAQLNGDAPLMFDMIVSPLPHIREGTLRPLMVTTAVRSKELPDVPTSKELGIADLIMPTWFGLIGPKGMPEDIANQINATVGDVLRDPEIVDTLAKQGLTATPSTQEDFRKFVVDSIAIIDRAATAASIPKVDG